MSNQYFFQPGRMESQYNLTKVETVLFQSSATNAAVTDGKLAVLGDMALEAVYTAAYGANRYDLNTIIATIPGTDTVAGVGVINIAGVPTVSNGSGTNTYRIGSETIGLTAAAGVPVRFRVFSMNDRFFTGGDNFTSTPTVGQYAIVDSTNGNWKPSSTVPGTGLVAKVVSSSALSQGIDASVTQYFLRIVQLA